MKIVVGVRCLNEERNIERFLKSYWFADKIVISDGGSTDKSLEILDKYKKKYPDKIDIVHFEHYVIINGKFWNEDNPHIQFVIDRMKYHEPEFCIFDDMDDACNYLLRENAREILEKTDKPQVNVFRLYLWGDTHYFPKMNGNFNASYKSLWAWKPNLVNIHADQTQKHGTILGLSDNYLGLDIPYCLLHKSWSEENIKEKLDKYNAIGLPMNHPFDFAGSLEKLPDWAVE